MEDLFEQWWVTQSFEHDVLDGEEVMWLARKELARKAFWAGRESAFGRDEQG